MQRHQRHPVILAVKGIYVSHKGNLFQEPPKRWLHPVRLRLIIRRHVHFRKIQLGRHFCFPGYFRILRPHRRICLKGFFIGSCLVHQFLDVRQAISRLIRSFQTQLFRIPGPLQNIPDHFGGSLLCSLFPEGTDQIGK